MNRRWNAPERTEVDHTRGTSRGVSKPSARRPSLSKGIKASSIKHTTSSPGYPRSNGFIERHIQTVKNMLSKSSNTRSFQEVLADLRTTRIGAGLPSPAEILHGSHLLRYFMEGT